MSFDVAADAYARFMGVYSEPLADRFVDLLDLRAGQRVLDVGCGPGVLTARLASRLGASSVVAIDPSAPFVEATRRRVPGVEVHEGLAEDLPFVDDMFDLSAAQLVVHFMSDPVAGLTEMARVTGPGGVVAACVWDHAGDAGPLAAFWRAVHDIDPDAPGEADLAGTREGHLAQLFGEAGLQDVEPATLSVRVRFATFEDWWQPFTLGVGPAGGYVAALDDEGRDVLRARCAQLLPDAPFEITAVAWCAVGRA